jgi:hypothetical protein
MSIHQVVSVWVSVAAEGIRRTVSTIGVWPSLEQAARATKYQMMGRIRVGGLLPL